MKLDDRWARATPFEIGLPGEETAGEMFSAIRREAKERDVDPTDPGAFVQLGEVGRAIGGLQGGDRGADALQRLGAFLFHAFHFHEAGRPLLLLEASAARRVTKATFEPSWDATLPAGAGYLQLPRNLFWSQGASETPEPVDGGFWARARGRTLSLALATGMRAGRPGFSLIDVPPVALDTLAMLPSDTIRDDGRDFETTLPGGELDRLYSIATLGEALKLFARVFALLSGYPETLGPEERAPVRSEPGHGTLPASMLPFRRVAWMGGEGDDEDEAQR